MILAASIIAFGTVAWLIASAIRNAHVCTCGQRECGGGCVTQAEEPTNDG